MYKFLLCWRYLRTRYIALASVVSVTLGVWIMIVVNSVMSGFSHEMQGRIHGFLLSDVEVEAQSLTKAFVIRNCTCSRFATIAGKVHRRHDADGQKCRRCSAINTVTVG